LRSILPLLLKRKKMKKSKKNSGMLNELYIFVEILKTLQIIT